MRSAMSSRPRAYRPWIRRRRRSLRYAATSVRAQTGSSSTANVLRCTLESTLKLFQPYFVTRDGALALWLSKRGKWEDVETIVLELRKLLEDPLHAVPGTAPRFRRGCMAEHGH